MLLHYLLKLLLLRLIQHLLLHGSNVNVSNEEIGSSVQCMCVEQLGSFVLDTDHVELVDLVVVTQLRSTASATTLFTTTYITVSDDKITSYLLLNLLLHLTLHGSVTKVDNKEIVRSIKHTSDEELFGFALDSSDVELDDSVDDTELGYTAHATASSTTTSTTAYATRPTTAVFCY